MDISNQNSNGLYIPLQEQSFSNSQRYIPSQVYQAPQQNQQIIVNQPIMPRVIYVDSSKFTTSPCPMSCPFCKSQINTVVKKKWNWFSCVFCLWAGLCCWAGLQYCRNKQLNCYDADHSCPVCHNKIGDYSSC